MSRAEPLQGLPDFGAFVEVPETPVSLYPAHREPGRFRLLGGELRLARRRGGGAAPVPDLTLELVRGADPDLPPSPYGLLDLGFVGPVAAEATLEAALVATRKLHPGAVLEPVAPVGGVLTLRLPGESFGVEALAGAHRLPVHANGLGAVRFAHRLPRDTALLLRRALAEEVPGLHAVAALVFRGLAPRRATTVRYRPAELTAALGGPHLRSDLVRLLRRELASLPLEILADHAEGEHGEQTDPSLESALADHLTALHGRLEPPDDGDEHHVHLASEDDRQTTVDLSRPRAVERSRPLTFDPFAEARRLAAAVDPTNGEALVREIEVPPLETGVVTFDVIANLPPGRRGAELLALVIEAPPRPPARVQKLSRTISFEETDDEGGAGRAGRDRQQVRLRFAPNEPPEVRLTPLALVADAAGRVARLTGETRSHTLTAGDPGTSLTLAPRDFPVVFVAVSADAPLLEVAAVYGVLQRGDGSTSFTLTPREPAISLVIPEAEAATASLELSARDPAGEHPPVALGHRPAGARQGDGRREGVRLGLASLPGYGPQAVEVQVAFDGAPRDGTGALLALELQPQAGGESTTLAFTPGRSRRTWTYFSESPFTPGYRYRPAAPPGGDERSWSPVQPPSQSLFLSPDGSPRRNPMPDDPTDTTDAAGDAAGDGAGESLAGLRWWRDPHQPRRILLLPETPRPETGPQGDPTLSLLVAGETAFLQLSTRWDAAPEALEALEAHLDQRFPDQAGTFTFAAAPVTVEEAVLELSAGQPGDEPTVLATSRTSGAPSHTALFNLRLDAEQAARARAAIHGREGQLRVTYRATLAAGAPGEEHGESFSFSSSSSASRVRTVTRGGSGDDTGDDTSDDTSEHTTEHATGHAAAHRSASTGPAVSPLSASTDIARWFPGGGGDHVRTIGPSAPE